jgi:hypothetical protein
MCIGHVLAKGERICMRPDCCSPTTESNADWNRGSRIAAQVDGQTLLMLQELKTELLGELRQMKEERDTARTESKEHRAETEALKSAVHQLSDDVLDLGDKFRGTNGQIQELIEHFTNQALINPPPADEYEALSPKVGQVQMATMASMKEDEIHDMRDVQIDDKLLFSKTSRMQVREEGGKGGGEAHTQSSTNTGHPHRKNAHSLDRLHEPYFGNGSDLSPDNKNGTGVVCVLWRVTHIQRERERERERERMSERATLPPMTRQANRRSPL